MSILRCAPCWLGRTNSTVRAVDGVSLTLHAGETLGLVVSGLRKSTLARAIIGLQPVTEGEIFLSGKRIDHLTESYLPSVRRQIQMVFSGPVCFAQSPHDCRTDHSGTARHLSTAYARVKENYACCNCSNSSV